METWLTTLRTTVDANPADTEKAKQLATIHLWMGATNEHQALCRVLLAQAANSKEPTTHDRAAKAYLLQSHPDPETLRQAVASGRQALSLSNPNDANWGWFLITAAMAEVRAGQAAVAENLLNKALALAGDNDERRNLALAYRSVARVQLNRQSEARADLTQLETWLPKVQVSAAISPIFLDPDSMAVLLAREEARALVGVSSATRP